MVKGKASGTKVTPAMAKKAVALTPYGQRRLTLSHMGIATFPPCLLKMANVDELDLSRNLMVNLPSDAFGDLTSLSWLDLHSNKLEALPDSIGQLVGLTHLNLSNNRLTAAGLPSTLGLLTGLTSLNLGLNCLDDLPESMAALTGLQELCLFDNLLPQLPEWVKLLPSLTKLNTKRNPFSAQVYAESEDTALVAKSSLCEDCVAGRRQKSEVECEETGVCIDKVYAGLLTPNSVAMETQDVWRRKDALDGETPSGLEPDAIETDAIEPDAIETDAIETQCIPIV